MRTAVRVARKRLDIGLADVVRGLGACLHAADRSTVEHRLAASWFPATSVLPVLSARSGFDLLLSAVDWPAGSEVLLSGVSIPHLPVLVRAHGYVPVAVDVDPDTLRLDPEEIRLAVTGRTRALLHAQLLGARDDLADLAELAERYGLLLVEDRAEAYDGRDRSLGPHADVALHSFGTIKTLTCFGGGVVLVRDPALQARMREVQEGWPVQRTLGYAVKLLRGVAMLALAHPRVYPHFVRSVTALSGDHDAVVRRLSRGYRDDDLLTQLRHRPCTALLTLLASRLERDDPERVQLRARAGEHLAAALDPHVRRLGARASRRTHWLFPVLVDDPDALVAAGRAAGFDLTRGSSTLIALDPHLPRAHAAMRDVVYLPAYAGMSEEQLDRLAAVVNTATERDPATSGAGGDVGQVSGRAQQDSRCATRAGDAAHPPLPGEGEGGSGAAAPSGDGEPGRRQGPTEIGRELSRRGR